MCIIFFQTPNMFLVHKYTIKLLIPHWLINRSVRCSFWLRGNHQNIAETVRMPWAENIWEPLSQEFIFLTQRASQGGWCCWWLDAQGYQVQDGGASLRLSLLVTQWLPHSSSCCEVCLLRRVKEKGRRTKSKKTKVTTLTNRTQLFKWLFQESHPTLPT